MTMSEQIGKATAAAARVVAAVRPEQLEAPTPCEKYDVRGLANHMTGFLLMTELAAGKQPPPAGADPDHDFTRGDWQGIYAEHAPRVAAAWSQSAAWEGTTPFGPGVYPARFAAGITLMELVVHGWDLARATGQPFAVDDDVAAAARDVVDQIADRARQDGSFGAPVAVGDVPALDAALAASGRDARWKP